MLSDNQDLLVAREPELTRLDQFLSRALAGQGQLCLVAGAAGSGKSVLVAHFVQQAQQAHADLLVAVGSCYVYTGATNPFLPFRELLNLLLEEIQNRLASDERASKRLKDALLLSGQVLAEHGLDLIGTFITHERLSAIVRTTAKIGASTVKKASWFETLQTRLAGGPELIAAGGLDQSQILEQYVNLLRQVSQQTPLLLVVDDLQWADLASIALFFRLGRRLEQARVMVVGTYRPEEIALGREGERHPLEPILSELKRYLGDVTIDLDAAIEARGREFIEAYLDTRPNRFSPGFREALFEQTDGHPLFAVELMRNLQERGDLVKDEAGLWHERAELSWTDLPARVEGVIEERISRLDDGQRRSLMVASVEGDQFTAELVAQLRNVPVRDLVRELSGELQREHKLIRSAGVHRLGSQRLSRYQFTHQLIQSYLYDQLDPIERTYLHEDVGRGLETLYGDQVDEIAVELARHFELAELVDEARHYWQSAGHQAMARYANAEAVICFSRALNLTPETAQAERYGLLAAREKVLDWQGEREQQRLDLTTMTTLAEMMGDAAIQAAVALRRGWLADNTGEYETAVAEASHAATLAEEAGLAGALIEALALNGQALSHQRQLDAARARLVEALELARQAGDVAREARVLERLGVVAYRQQDLALAQQYLQQALPLAQVAADRHREWSILNNLGLALQPVDPAAAEAHFEAALRIVRATGHRLGEVKLQANLGRVHNHAGDFGRAHQAITAALAIARDIEDRRGEVWALIDLADVDLHLGKFDEAVEHAQEAAAMAQALGSQLNEEIALGNLALATLYKGEYGRSLAAAETALALAAAMDDRFGQGLLHNAAGAAALALEQPERAQAHFQAALAAWSELDDPVGQARAQVGLADVARQAGAAPRAEAHIDGAVALLDRIPDILDIDRRFPFDVYWACYQTLVARDTGPARTEAQALLAAAHNQLNSSADRISDPALRQFYLDHGPAHQEILAAFGETTRQAA